MKGLNCMDEKDVISFGKAQPNIEEDNYTHTPSQIQADTLFTFTSHLEYLIPIITNKMISPRYCTEDITYLNIPNLKRIAFPMKCFCDINLHKLEIHLEWYGYYGLAFSKEWGMKKGIQPIQYINPSSELCKDFSIAFSSALQSDPEKETEAEQNMKNFLLHELMYYKPYEGMMKKRTTGIEEKKCFTDECEWRFVPDVTAAQYEQAYYNETILNAGSLMDISNSMSGNRDISLCFEYQDVKYIIVKSISDHEKLVTEIDGLDIEKSVKYQLISKIIIWDNSRGDF